MIGENKIIEDLQTNTAGGFTWDGAAVLLDAKAGTYSHPSPQPLNQGFCRLRL